MIIPLTLTLDLRFLPPRRGPEIHGGEGNGTYLRHKHTTIRREPPLFVIARSASDEAIPVGEALRRECLPHGDCHGREKRGLAMTSFFK